MTALLMGGTLLTCLGDGPATFAALLAGRNGRRRLGGDRARRLRVAYGYRIDPAPPLFAASAWLARCVGEAIQRSGIDATRSRVACVVGTGLRELPTVEDAELADVPVHRLHFADAVRAVAPGVRDIITLANACAAGGHALALAQDMVELGDADAVVVAGTDGVTESMLAMIGRVVDRPTEWVRPFDADRQGVLLGDGAAAVVVVPDDGRPGADGRLLGTGLSCDAFHETAPSPAGIARAMHDALERAGVSAADIALVVAHGTGTALNDPAECAALTEVLAERGGDPVVTGVKGAVGHMSGTAALANLDVAIRSLRAGVAPPVIGLRSALPEAGRLRLAHTCTPLGPGVAQVDAFGFGGVNAVTVVAVP